MKIFISEEDRQNARKAALINIASFFKIPDWNIKSNDKLYNEVMSLKNKSAVNIIKLLGEYFIAYDEWFMFYQKIKDSEQKTNKEHKLDTKELTELASLIEKREKSLKALQEEFDQLQLAEFNRKNFGKNIPGIIKND